jgi:hypothetical protein
MTLSSCDYCEKVIGPLKDAVLDVDQYEATQRWRIIKEFEDSTEGQAVSAADMAKLPDLVPWMWGHRTCGPASTYWFKADRIDNPKKALGWTLHLMKKVWFSATDWETAMRRFAFVEDD